MDFLFYLNIKEKIDINNIIVDLCSNQEVFVRDNFLFAKRSITPFLFDEYDNTLLMLSGRVKYSDKNDIDSTSELLSNIINKKWPLEDNFDGVFSGFIFNNDNIYIFNDPIGLFHLYYYISDERVVISTNLSSLQRILNTSKKISSIILEASPSVFSQFGKSTILNDVYTLLPGELLIKEPSKQTISYFDTTIKSDEIEPSSDYSSEIVDFINKNYENFYLNRNDLLLTMSGGVDSRINLAPLYKIQKKITFINYGKKSFIDSKIPNKIAKKLKYNIKIIDSIPYQFPNQDIINKTIKETDSLFINHWIAINESEKEKYKTILLGDMCDILRAKNISSKKTRAFRIRFYIKKFLFGKKMELSEISQSSKDEFKKEQIRKIVNSVEKSLLYFNIIIEKEVIIKEIIEDINQLFEHIDRYNVNTIESYEELFGIFTMGRKSMGKQLNVLKMKFNPEIPILNMKIVRKVLNISPNFRYSDELTNKMFKHHSWKIVGNFSTAQNPFIPYNSPYFLMLFGWFFRSIIDQLLIKIYLLTKGKSKRTRIFPSYDLKAVYNYPGANSNFKLYFSKLFNPKELIVIFENRKDDSSWPLTSQDLIPYIQADYYLNNL